MTSEKAHKADSEDTNMKMSDADSSFRKFD